MTLMPFLKTPWKHQVRAIEMAVKQPEFAFFMEMGTGKTAATINTLRYRYGMAGKVLRTLIVCPIVVCNNWRTEFGVHSKVQPKVLVLKGAGKKRLAEFKERIASDPNIIVVTNFEFVEMKELYKAVQAWLPEIMVVDESQRIKNYRAVRTKSIIKLGDLARYRYILSGTPILNNAMDIFGQFRFLDRGATFPRNFVEFRAKYFVDKNASMPKQSYFPDWRPKDGLEEEFNRLIYKKAIRVLKKDCLDLPPVVRKQVSVELSGEQERMYKQMKKNFIAYLDDKACVATIALTKMLRLQQMLCGFFVDDEGVAHHYEDIPRLDALMDLLEIAVPASKVIVWASFKETYRDIENRIDKPGRNYQYRFLVGGMTDKQRQTAIDDFQTRDDVRVLVANQQAGGVGVNLTAANVMIYYSRTWSLEADLQSEARAHRGGSEIHDKITRIDLVAPGTVDEVILEALAHKENLADKILTIKGRL